MRSLDQMRFLDIVIAGDWRSTWIMTNENPDDNKETARKRRKLVSHLLQSIFYNSPLKKARFDEWTYICKSLTGTVPEKLQTKFDRIQRAAQEITPGWRKIDEESWARFMKFENQFALAERTRKAEAIQKAKEAEKPMNRLPRAAYDEVAAEKARVSARCKLPVRCGWKCSFTICNR